MVETALGELVAELRIEVPVSNGPRLTADSASVYAGQFDVDRLWLKVVVLEGHWVIDVADVSGQMRTAKGRRSVRRGSAVYRRPLHGGDPEVPMEVAYLLREAMTRLPK